MRFAVSLGFKEGQSTTAWRIGTLGNTFLAWQRGLEFGIFGHTPPKKWALRLGPTGPRRRSVLPPTKQPQPNYLLGPSGLAIFRNGLPSQKPQPKRTVRYSPLERRKCTSPQFFALSMSVPRPRTCRAQLRPRRVLQLGSLVFSCCF